MQKKGISLTPEKRRKISELASIVSYALKLQSPIGANQAVVKLGDALEFVDPSEIGYEAVVEKQETGFCIRIANNKTEEHQNFSVVHEIATS